MTGFDIKDLESAVETLKAGGIILYPTDTVWGIGCDATNADAVKRIYRIKGRDDSKSMLVLVGSLKMLEDIVSSFPEEAKRQIGSARRPLTVIYEHPGGVASNLLAEDGSLGIRMTSEEFSMRLCEKFGKPIVSTSANFSGEPTPSSFSEINPAIISKMDYVVNYRRADNEKKTASRIIKITDKGEIKIIRP